MIILLILFLTFITERPLWASEAAQAQATEGQKSITGKRNLSALGVKHNKENIRWNPAKKARTIIFHNFGEDVEIHLKQL